jgi:hypothetical protein
MGDLKEDTAQDREEAIDLEKAARDGRKPPRGRTYRVRIDDVKHQIDEDVVTGRELLELAGRTPVDDYILILRVWGETNEVVGADDEVNLARRGIERFVTGRQDDDIVVTVFAPRSPEPKHFTWDEDLTVQEAASEAADAFGYNAGSPGLQDEDEVLDPDKTLEEAGVTHGDELELFDTGGGV